MITPIGVAYALLALLVVRSRLGPQRLIAVTVGVPLGTAAFVGGQSVTLFYAGAMVLIVMAGLRLAAHPPLLVGSVDRSGPPRRLDQIPGAVALIVFASWAALVTVVAPTLFRDIPVLVPRGGLDLQLVDPGRLTYTISNLAQILYLILSVVVIVYLARAQGVHGLVGIALATLTLLTFWRLISTYTGVPFPEGVFDNSRNVRFIESSPGGGLRFRGIVSEPSSLGEMSLTAMAYFTACLPRVRGWWRVGAAGMVVLALVNGLASTSATFIAAGVIVAAVAVIAGFVGFTLRHSILSPVFFAAVCGLVIAGTLLAPLAAQLVGDVVSEKVDSSSYVSRSGVDVFSLLLTVHTWGIGVGLGSNRASSGVTTLLSSVGVPGFVAFAVFVRTMLVRTWNHSAVRPTAWAVITLLVSKAIAGPNVLDPLMTLCLGVLASLAWMRPRRSEGPPGIRADPPWTGTLRSVPTATR